MLEWSETKMRLMGRSLTEVILFMAPVIVIRSLQSILVHCSTLEDCWLISLLCHIFAKKDLASVVKKKSCCGASPSNKKQDNLSCLSGAIEAVRSIQEFKTKASQVQSHFIDWLVKSEANAYGQVQWMEALVSLAWKLWENSWSRMWHLYLHNGAVRLE